MKTTKALYFSLIISFAGPSFANLTPGLISDFSDGTQQGWDGGALPEVIPNGGPNGAGDQYLQVGSSAFALRLATFNTTVGGTISPSVGAIQVDLLGGLGQPALDMRLVLFGPGTSNRWTSATPQTVAANGVWDTYTFSLLEADLTQVQGSDSYANLLGNLDRIMFRYDPAPADPGGQAVQATLGIDNVFAITPPIAGDYDGNGVVDAVDYQSWSNTFGQAGAGLAADGNGNGIVDAADYTVWRDALGVGVASVPEPSSFALIGIGLVLWRRLPR